VQALPFWKALVAVIAIAFLLRGALLAVPPVVSQLADDLHLSESQLGALTSIPALCFAVVTPFASVFIGRAGANAATTVLILGVSVGTLLRSAGESSTLIIGTVVLGVFVSVGNVVVPVLIRRDISPGRQAIATGVYTAALNAASMLTSLTTAPVAIAHGWRAALALWVVLALVAFGVWFAVLGPRNAVHWGPMQRLIETGAVETVPVTTRSLHVKGGADHRSVWVTPTAIALATTFAGQSFAYYGVTAWIPTLLEDRFGLNTTAAGASSSVFQIAAVLGALSAPLLVQRCGPLAVMIGLSVLWFSLPLGLLTAGSTWGLWVLLGGIAQGGGITMVFTLVVRIATSDARTRQLTAMVQVVGYAVAACAPTSVGAALQATGGWDVPLLVISAGVALFAVGGVVVTTRVRREETR
jgi:CP family cyanate transporter-like MFS transporter